MNEFELIERYFTSRAIERDDVLLGIGDDGALLDATGDDALVVVADTLVGGVHFPSDAPPDSIGHKALAVNLSDIAAMGAEPAWATMCLTIPAAEEQWLEAFAGGFHQLARRHRVALVGGDCTRGPLCVSVQVIGRVPRLQALRRAGAAAGDLVCVSGTLGDAALALAAAERASCLDDDCRQALERRLHWPEPRLALGVAARGIASAAIDVSDGLVADLGHILESGNALGAWVEVDDLPLSACYRSVAERVGMQAALTGGDDYELLLTVPETGLAALRRAAHGTVPLTVIGRIVDEFRGLRLRRAGQPFELPAAGGWRHF